MLSRMMMFIISLEATESHEIGIFRISLPATWQQNLEMSKKEKKNTD